MKQIKVRKEKKKKLNKKKNVWGFHQMVMHVIKGFITPMDGKIHRFNNSMETFSILI